MQLLSPVRLFVTPWTAVYQTPLSLTTSQSLLKFMSIELVMPSSHLILCYPFLLLPSIFPSIQVFSSELGLHIRCQSKSFSLSISPFNEYLGLIYFRIDWFDLLQSKGLSTVFSSTTIWKHPFFSAKPSLWSNSYICTWLLGKT